METEQMERIEALAKQIILMARDSLVVNFRFLDGAISRLELLSTREVPNFSTDGAHIAYNPMAVIREYKQEKNSVTRRYLHTVLHCVYQHLFVGPAVRQEYWDLACDIAVEKTINDLAFVGAETAQTKLQKPKLEDLKAKVKYMTAEHLYRYFVGNNFSEAEAKQLHSLFAQQSHDNWYNGTAGASLQAEPVNLMELREDWKRISARMQVDLETFGMQRGSNSGAMTENLQAVNREKYDYTTFLKKFAVLGEAMKINDDEFDYVFYTYGLQLYKTMPLIEPLEYKEVKRIREFVIAIDTSGSTSGELVQKFVKKTYNILKQSESFFSKINLHIIQCDADIQEDRKITCQEDFDEYIKNMKIHGLGGTDFRPVFEYVEQLRQNREFANLKGLIYFTDGYGVFPEQKPDYNTAFVFIYDDNNNPNVPAWAIKLVLQPEEIS